MQVCDGFALALQRLVLQQLLLSKHPAYLGDVPNLALRGSTRAYKLYSIYDPLDLGGSCVSVARL